LETRSNTCAGPCRRWDNSGQAPYLIAMPKIIIDDKKNPEQYAIL